MSIGSEPLESAPDSPVESGQTLADRFTVGPRYAVWGDVHLHEGSSPGGPVRIAVFKYQGSQPIPKFIQALDTDADGWRSVRHGNLLPTLEASRQRGKLLCSWVIEAAGGITLAERLYDHPMIAPDAALHIALQVGHALAEIHRAGLVHGDLDPVNVHLVGTNDRVRLAWGGLALRIEHAGMDAGRGSTRTYAEVAPEILDQGRPDPRADVYALGALLYRMMAGQPPFLVRKGGAPPGVGIGSPLGGLPDHVPEDLVACLDDLLQRDPGRRPVSMPEVLDTLAKIEAKTRGMRVPAGVWAPVSTGSEDSTPPTTQRTLTPAMRRDEFDPALSNTPPSALRRAPTPEGASARSLMPGTPVSTGIASMQPPRPDPMPQPVPSSSGGTPWLPMLAGSAVIALMVLAGVALLALIPAFFAPDPAPLPTPLPTTVITQAPVAPPPPVAPDAPAVLTLRTDPPGAEVFEGDVNHGLTPIELLLSGGPADPPRELRLVLRGYAPHTVRQPWTDQPVQHSVPLQKLVRTTTPKPPPRPESKPGLPVREER